MFNFTPPDDGSLPENTPPTPAEEPCRSCGVLGLHVVKPGTPPHAFGLWCQEQACHKFIRWVSSKTQAEREASRTFHREAAMAAKPPTPNQLSFLSALGYTSTVSSMISASRMIDYLRGRIA